MAKSKCWLKPNEPPLGLDTWRRRTRCGQKMQSYVVVLLCCTVCAKELKFMHVTKTGGTSIERAGMKLNVSWGKFHTFTEKAYGFWHDLPTRKNPHLIRKYDWFTVVRNPFTRVVSEFWCPWGGRGRPNEVNISSFNAFVAQQVTSQHHRFAGHWTPQAKYLSVLSFGPDMLLRVLHFESLRDDFARLCRLSGLPAVDLPTLNVQTHSFNVSHFMPDTLNLIRNAYELDFEVFGYSGDPDKALLVKPFTTMKAS